MMPARSLKVVDFDQGRHVLRYRFPPIETPEDLQDAIVKLIGVRAGSMTPNKDRSFFTFGSCFAENLAAALKLKGAKVYTTMVTEDVNSPFNNLMMLKRVFLDERSQFSEELAANSNVNYDAMREEFAKATHIIFTLGNIFRIKNDKGHMLLPTKDAWLVRETFDETVASLREVLALLRAHTNAEIFVSVSPIPISGYMGSEFLSAIEADCASKCQLLTAIRTLSGFTYIPTFEIFRWLAAHQSFASFGSGGGNARHLYERHIGMVMGVLCRE
tara:strand:- start:2118 stop:2936 length:819 start_codon:yes stop_codon:yes gene_type:complete